MILYFSATGNNQYVAEQIAMATNDRVISIREHLKEGSMEVTLSDNENFGIVMPTYFQGMPLFIEELVSNMKVHDEGGEHYAYSVSTCGASYGNSGSEAVRAAAKAGIHLDATYAIHMVDNWNPYFDMTDKDYIAEAETTADRELSQVISSIVAKASVYLENSFNESKEEELRKNYEESRKTNLFSVSDKCVGCKVCQNQCPVSAIQVTENRPQWVKDKCLLCLGCVHKCPKNAIAYTDATIGHGQYSNPHVKQIC